MTITVEEAAKKLELTGPFPQHQYVKHMERVFGRDGVRFLDAVDSWLASGADPADADRLYSMLSKRPLMAAYVTRHQFSELYKQVGAALTAWDQLRDRSVVDIGCGFGHLTNLLARLHPSSRFVGVDKTNIVATARRLSSSPLVPNLEFKAANELADASAQVVVMICVTHEAFPSVMAPDTQPMASELDFARKISGLTRMDGLLVTVNRFPYAIWQLPALDRLFASFGVHPCDVGLPSSIGLLEGGETSVLHARGYRHT